MHFCALANCHPNGENTYRHSNIDAILRKNSLSIQISLKDNRWKSQLTPIFCHQISPSRKLRIRTKIPFNIRTIHPPHLTPATISHRIHHKCNPDESRITCKPPFSNGLSSNPHLIHTQPTGEPVKTIRGSLPAQPAQMHVFAYQPPGATVQREEFHAERIQPRSVRNFNYRTCIPQ